MSGIFEDTKTFVDVEMKYSSNETITKFLCMKSNSGVPGDLKYFVDKNFD